MVRRRGMLAFFLSVVLSLIAQELFGESITTSMALIVDETCSPPTQKLADFLEVKLAKSLPVQLLERATIERIFDELELSAGGLVGAESVLKLGQLCGANLLLHVREYDGIHEQRYMVFAAFSTSSALKLGQLAMPLFKLETEAASVRVTNFLKEVIGRFHKKSNSNQTIAFLGMHSLELDDSLDRYAAQTADMLERFLLSEEGAALLNLGEVHLQGKERRLRADVAEKLSLSGRLLKADIEWAAFPRTIQLTLYLSGHDDNNTGNDACIFAAEEFPGCLSVFFRKALSTRTTKESSLPLNRDREAEKLYQLAKSLFERKRFSSAASYAQTACYLAPTRKDFSLLAGRALIEQARTVLYAEIKPGRQPQKADKVNVALRLLPRAFDLLVVGESQNENPFLGLHAIANSQLFGWVTSVRGWPLHFEALEAIQDKLYDITFRAFQKLRDYESPVTENYGSFGFCLRPWYYVTDDVPRTLRLWQLLLVNGDVMTPGCRNNVGSSVAGDFWDLIGQGAPRGGGKTYLQEVLCGHEPEMEAFYHRMAASEHSEFREWGKAGLKRLRQFPELGETGDNLKTMIKESPRLRVEYLMKISRNYEEALALAKSLLASGDYEDDINLKSTVRQLERLLKQQHGEGDPFWGNGHRLFPPNSIEDWTFGGACLLDNVLWFVGYKHRQQQTVDLQLISIDTRTAERRVWSRFQITSSEAEQYRPVSGGEFLNSHRLCRLGDSFYFASCSHGILRFPLEKEEAISIDRERGMPANTCIRVVTHRNWVFAVFCNTETWYQARTALVAWNPQSGEQKLIVHPSKPSLFPTTGTSKESRIVRIVDAASDPYKDCVWFITIDENWDKTDKRWIQGVWRVDISPWKLTHADFPPYTDLVCKQTHSWSAQTIEATSSALWFNHNARFGKWLAYDFESNQLLSPSHIWLGEIAYGGGPYVRSDHYIFFGSIHFLDTRTRQQHTLAQTPGYLSDPNPMLIAGAERGLVLIMAHHAGSMGKHEVWLIDTTKDL